jgi:F-type H+-transporting ATPase subunit c
MKNWLVKLVMALAVLLAGGPVMAAAEAGAATTDSSAKVAIALAAGLAIAIAAFGAALAQGRLAAAAMESIGRNPNAADRIFTPLLLSLAFIEALAIYALIIAFILQGKI